MRGLKIIAFVIVAVAIGLGVGWFASRPKTVATTDLSLNDNNASGQTGTAAQGHSGSSGSTQSGAPTEQASSLHRTATTPDVTLAGTNPKKTGTNEIIPDWEDKVSDIIVSDSDFTNKCAEMLAMFPNLPESGQVEVSHHLVNLTSDENFGPLGKLLMDPKTPEGADEVLMTDMLNRNNSLKLPILLQVARTPNHPKAAEAKDMLERMLEEDYGTDWNQWENKMRSWLKENPD
jgi:hypothetical protein